MLTSTRREKILSRLNGGGDVGVEELATGLGVSASTIRRDLNVMAGNGLLRRVRGGAQTSLEAEAEPFPTISTRSAEAKDAVGARAAQMVSDGDVVLIDIGTTTARLAHHLRERRITVVTASLAVVDELRHADSVDLVVLGGALRRSYFSMVGPLTEQAISDLHADLCFVSTSGVGTTGQVMDTTGVEVPIKQALLRSAARRVLLADRNKFPGSGVLRVAGPESFEAVVTNDGADPAALSVFTQAGVEVVLT